MHSIIGNVKGVTDMYDILLAEVNLEIQVNLFFLFRTW